MYIYDISWRVS